MTTRAWRGATDQGGLNRLALGVLAAILVLHGTYIRSRSNVSVPTVDWVILARVLACAAGLGIGLLLLRKALPLGFGAKALLLYGFAASLSAVSCPHAKMVVGYSILLVGASMLMIVLVNAARDLSQLRGIEKLWFVTVALLVVKDTFINRSAGASAAGADVTRLGMGSTHPCELSLLATLLFWMSFGRERGRCPAGMWLLRVFLIYVLIAAETRTSIVAFVLAGLVRYLLAAQDPLKRVVVAGAVAGTLSTFAALNVCSSQSWASGMVGYVKRGQDTEQLTSLTGRTVIWNHVLPKTWETPICGHGYGVSRFTMGQPRDAGFQPMHCHNALLEVFFSTGFVGLIPFVAMLLYSLKWIVASARLQHVVSKGLALNAAAAVTALLVASLFEARLAVRLSLFEPLFFFYLITLDRERYFHKLSLERERARYDTREHLCIGHSGPQ